MPELPENYTNIIQLNVENQSLLVTNCNQKVFSLLNLKLEMKQQWLDALRESVEDTTIPLSLSAFFSSDLNPCQNISDIPALLPLLPKSINSTRASRIGNLGTRFFVHPITFLCTRSCTSNFARLK